MTSTSERATGGQRRVARWPLVALAALTGLVLVTAPASGHALLVSTSPADGETVATAPRAVQLEFDEAVQTPTAGVRIYDSAGRRVDEGRVRQVAPDSVAIDMPADAAAGAYIVTWRAISADGHPINGAFVFAVGAAATVADDLLAEVVASGNAPVLAAVGAVSRGLGYAGTLLAAGAVVFLLWVAGRDRDARGRARTWAQRGAVVGLAATAVGIPLQAMATTGLGAASLAPSVLVSTLASGFGTASILRLGALGVLVMAVRSPPTGWSLPATGAAAGAALASFVLDGHTRTVGPAVVMVGADVVHLAAGAAWFGGLVVLASTLRARRLEDDPLGAARLVARFSGLATVTAIVVSLAGIGLSVVLVQAPRALTSTTYGWTLLLKVAVVAAVILVGAYNNRRLVPLVAAAGQRMARGGPARRAWPIPSGGATDVVPAAAADERILAASSAAWASLRRTVRFEAAALVAVLLVTGFLVNQRPAADAAGITGAYTASAVLTDDLDVELVVDPNRAGTNQLHLYILDNTGRPAADIDDVRLLLTQTARDIGPIERVPQRAAAGHWVHTGNELSIAGPWTIEVVAGLDRFDEATAAIEVTVNAVAGDAVH